MYMKSNEIQEYRLLSITGNEIKDNGTRWGTLEMLRGDFPGSGWAIVPVDSVPDNWSEMAIEAGELAPATTEVIEMRRATRHAANVAAVRSPPESRYRAESDPTLYDALEAFGRNAPPDTRCKPTNCSTTPSKPSPETTRNTPSSPSGSPPKTASAPSWPNPKPLIWNSR